MPWALSLLCCRRLGTYINGQRSTLAEPSAFFGVLHAFAEELATAHEENSAMDAVSSKAAGRKVGGWVVRRVGGCMCLF